LRVSIESNGDIDIAWTLNVSSLFRNNIYNVEFIFVE
jgi:hypothetical protein